MGILISAALKKKLPEHERKGIEKRLLTKSAKICHLCDGPLIEASHKIVADHDLPEAEGGKTEESNLNLTHHECNSFKRNHPTVEVRPFLKLSAEIKAMGGQVRYDGAAKAFGIKPVPVGLKLEEDEVTITQKNGTSKTYPVFSESTKEGKFKFCFAELERSSLFNDEECQPRSIKLTHAWQIYSDIGRNPLHEQPGCRVEKIKKGQESHRVLMFDGQHKSIAFWLAGRKKITVKLYLDISKDAAVRLVNSIQAKIKKLPLSPFELAAKMAEEWQERVETYEGVVGTEGASEDGFIQWVEQDERRRAKAAFVDALYQSIIDDQNLEFIKLVTKSGQKPISSISITEATFKNKVLKPMLHTNPLKESFSESQKSRSNERNLIIRVLNFFYQEAFDGELTEKDKIRAKRLSYQASLNYVSSLLRKLVGHILVVEPPREMLEKYPSDERMKALEDSVNRLLEHPVWTADLDGNEKVRSLGEALSKNQNADKSFSDLDLKLGYVIGADDLSDNWPN